MAKIRSHILIMIIMMVYITIICMGGVLILIIIRIIGRSHLQLYVAGTAHITISLLIIPTIYNIHILKIMRRALISFLIIESQRRTPTI